MKKQWISISPLVYVRFAKNKVLLFDTVTGEYIISSCEQLIKLIHKLHSNNAMGVMESKISMMDYPDINNGLSKKLLFISSLENKPFIFLPYLKIIRDLSELDRGGKHDVELYIPSYLSQLNIFLTQTKISNDNHLNNIRVQNQIAAPIFAKNNMVMSSELLDEILTEINITLIKNISLYISGEEDMNKLALLREILRKHPYKYKIISYLNQLEKLKKLLPLKNTSLEILTTPSAIENHLTNNQLPSYVTSIHFLIENEIDYNISKRVEALLINECKFEYHPIFTEDNKNFFKQNVFLSKDDILEQNYTFEKIFKHQKLNSNFFGTLNIYPKGIVKASTHSKSLGNLNKDTLLSIIKKELVNNTAWRKIRRKRPCNKCLFQFLCPSPSNYEYVLKTNLCIIDCDK